MGPRRSRTINMGSTTVSCNYCCGLVQDCECACLNTESNLGPWMDTEPVCPFGTQTRNSTEAACVDLFGEGALVPCTTRTCYACEETECCNAFGTCTDLLTACVCDNNPGDGTPDGGPCCDQYCVGCGDCGVGGAECCGPQIPLG
jgi:hypothetical protein